MPRSWGGRVILNISANMNDRKSFEWIKYAHTNYEADYIFKMDTDTNICLRNLESELEGAFEDACDYIGKKMDYIRCGSHDEEAFGKLIESQIKQ